MDRNTLPQSHVPTAISNRCQGKGHLRTVHDRKRQRAERKNRQKQRNIDRCAPEAYELGVRHARIRAHRHRPSQQRSRHGIMGRFRFPQARYIATDRDILSVPTSRNRNRPARPSSPAAPGSFRRTPASVSASKKRNRVSENKRSDTRHRHHGIRTADQNNPFSYFALTFSNISTVIVSRFHVGDHPHSSRAQLSSIESGQLRAMFSLIGSTL